MRSIIINVYDRYANIGVKKNYLPWEIYLTRKLNLISLIAFVNVSAALIIYEFLGFREIHKEFVFVLLMSPLIVLFNAKKNYIWAVYLFNIAGYIFFALLNLKMGEESYCFVFYFPMILSTVQLLARKETVKHMLAIFFICICSIAIVLVGFSHNWLHIDHSKEMMAVLKLMNLVFGFTVTFLFMASLAIETIKQENLIRSMLSEKETLLAEVFHRVKNNMNIVTSLLNLKKNTSDSEEVKEALEECRNRVFSMALVHQNIYQTKNFTNLDLNEYVHDLVDELINSNASKDQVEVFIKCDEINLELTNAVPFGLILNELITNAFKHAQIPEKKLRIDINVKKEGKNIVLVVKDNGPGFKGSKVKKGSLGMELIKSLSEQIDGDFIFKNDAGLKFNLTFKA